MVKSNNPDFYKNGVHLCDADHNVIQYDCSLASAQTVQHSLKADNQPFADDTIYPHKDSLSVQSLCSLPNRKSS